MERMKPRDVAFVQLLNRLDKPYFTVADLEKVLDLKRESLYVTLHRLVQYGVLRRLRRGIYQLSLRPNDVPRIANPLYSPSYLSFESALARYGVLSQIPYTVTFATSKRSKRMTIGETEVEFRQIRPDLFFGYVLDQGLYLAEPEKALLDEMYLVRRGRADLPLDELYLEDLDVEKLFEYASRFPPYVRDSVIALVPS